MYVCPYVSKSVCPEPKISVTANSDNYVVFGKYIYWSCVGLNFFLPNPRNLECQITETWPHNIHYT